MDAKFSQCRDFEASVESDELVSDQAGAPNTWTGGSVSLELHFDEAGFMIS